MTNEAKKARRGFAAMDADKQREIAGKGGKTAHALGKAHQFTTEEARIAGRKGGLATQAANAIAVGDLVRIVEDADMYDNQRLIYIQDIQEVGIVRGHDGGSFCMIDFPSGMKVALPENEVYLVDVDALHEEMEEMMAEEAQYAGDEPETETEQTLRGMFVMANRVKEADEARIEELKTALELEHVRVLELEAALTPFVLAAQVARQRGTPELFTLVTTWDEEEILVSGNGDDENDFLTVHYLFAAHRARYGTDA